MSTSTWNQFWSALQVGEGIQQGNMQVFPLTHKLPPAVDYLTLERALEIGRGHKFRVEEVSSAGSVTTLKVVNRLESPVLLVEGEILVGAKQNRTVHTTILVGERSDVTIPVACVQSGRWSPVPEGAFSLSDNYVHSSLRYRKVRSVSAARAAMGRAASQGGDLAYAVNQSEVWDDVQAFSTTGDVFSSTSDANEAYRNLRNKTASQPEFTYPRESAGIAIAIDGRLVGVDCFDRPSTMERIFPRLIQSYLSELSMRSFLGQIKKEKVGGGEESRSGWARFFRQSRGSSGHTSPDQEDTTTQAPITPMTASDVESCLSRVRSSEAAAASGVGLGEDLRAQGDDWTAAVLTYRGGSLHGQVLFSADARVAAFPPARRL